MSTTRRDPADGASRSWARPVPAATGTLNTMRVVEIMRRPTDVERDQLVDFIEHVTEDTGAQPLSDHLWLDLRSGGAPGFLVVRVSDDSGTIAMAQVSTANDAASLEVVVRRDVVDDTALLVDAADTALDTIARRGGGRVNWWVDDPTAAVTEVAAMHDLHPTRALHEMRRGLPAERRSNVITRAFVPGRDDAAWLDVNNRAFADHGEQGGWSVETLAQRFDEAWFDPEGFRLHERDGRLAAFCWTKLHDTEPVIGEIYVIAVDPDFHGQGLGRELTLAGLDSIADRGVDHATLYVDADNAAAVGLYTRLGFHIHRTRRSYTGLVPNSGVPAP
jgi:mycothiol synthase